MKNKKISWFGLVIGLSALMLAACTPSTPATSKPEPTATSAPESVDVIGPLQVGDMAPDFTLPDSNGNLVNLADELQENEQVVIVFYYSYTCAPCMTQLRNIEKDRALYEESGAKVIAVAIQSVTTAGISVRASQAQFPILVDSDHIVGEAFGVYDLFPEDFGRVHPSVFVINQERRIVWNHILSPHFKEGEIPMKVCGGARVASPTILENLVEIN